MLYADAHSCTSGFAITMMTHNHQHVLYISLQHSLLGFRVPCVIILHHFINSDKTVVCNENAVQDVQRYACVHISHLATSAQKYITQAAKSRVILTFVVLLTICPTSP